MSHRRRLRDRAELQRRVIPDSGMPPSTTMMDTRPAPNNEPKKSTDHSLRIDELTRKRLAQKQMERKKNDMNSSMRRSLMNESMGKWTGEPKPVKKKKSTNELSGLSHTHHHGHTSSRNEYSRQSLSKSEHSSRPRKKSDGTLGAMLDYDTSQPRRKSDARTVATMPARADDSRSSRSGRRRVDPESPRGRSPGPIKHYPRSQSAGPAQIKKHYPRSQSPAAMPIQKHHPRSQSATPKREESPYRPLQKKYVSPAKRSQSPAAGRLEESPYKPLQKKYVSPAKSPARRRSESITATPIKKRSQSPGPMKKRTSSPTPVKKRSVSAGPIQRSAHTRRTDSVENDNRGKLGMMLSSDEKEKPKRPGTKSIASAPARSRPKTTPKKSKSTPSKSKSPTAVPKKTRPASSRGVNDTSRRVRRSRSADDVDLGVLEEHLNMSEDARMEENDNASRGSRKSRRSSSRKSSRRYEDSSAHGDSESVVDDRRQRLSKRAASMQPRVNVPSKQQHEEKVVDRRAGMKKNKSMPHHADHSHSEEAPSSPSRAQSMLMHREATRRVGKSSSLADLVQYSEEEIHSTSYFASNHVLVNRERMKRGLRPLTRNIAMDELARDNAKAMAESGGVAPIRATYVGNVLRGESIRAIHRSTMQQKQGRERANLLNPYFQDFGVGTCKGKDGMLYMCQLFSERLELTCADTASPNP